MSEPRCFVVNFLDTMKIYFPTGAENHINRHSLTLAVPLKEGCKVYPFSLFAEVSLGGHKDKEGNPRRQYL